MNTSSVLEHHADRNPDKLALVMGERRLTYSDLYASVQRTAGALSAIGIGAGEAVAALSHNSIEFLELVYGAAHLGAVLVPINWRLAPAEVGYIVGNSRSRALFAGSNLIETGDQAVAELAGCQLHDLDSADWRAKVDAAPPNPAPARVGTEDLARIMYTSGTTSHPKGVMVTHGNIFWKNAAHAVELAMSPDDRALACGPLYHVGALDLTTTTVFYVGGTNHILPGFDATTVLATVEREQITAIWLAPAMVNLLVASPALYKHDLASIRLIIDGGEKMPLPLIERIHDAFPNGWFADAYGLTETVGGDTFLDKRVSTTRPGSVGKAVIYHEVRVVDTEGRPVGAGVEAEIVIRGPKVTPGYWRNEEATLAAHRDGWFHTGDIGVLDEDGYLYVVDRLKDLIVSGGENIASLEVERVIFEHPAVIEVAVVAAPDERWNEVPAAYVVAREAIEAAVIENFCRERLAKFKVPRHIWFVDELPRNPSGKVLKVALREQARAAVQVPLKA